MARRTYIGQYELIAAVCVYYSLRDQLAGRAVCHWIDNTSAMAALAKGYSRAIDSARIVHAFHSWNVGAGVSVWFEYVRSKANIADMPSRGAFEMLHAMGSVEVAVELPPVSAWSRPAAEWMREAREAAWPRPKSVRSRKRARV